MMNDIKQLQSLTTRERTRQVSVGGVLVGGGAPIPVQSMTNTRTEDAQATLSQIRALADAGCDIVRCAVPTAEAAAALAEITALSPIPVVADIQFDYRLALASIRAGAAKIRINPGNIGGARRVAEIAEAAGNAGIPIRIGVNGGSLEKELLAKHGGVTAVALAESAIHQVELLHGMGFYDLVVSVKSSDVGMNLAAHRLLAERTDHPLHIGITEAGVLQAALVKSAVGIGALLCDGIGDTVRVSLTGDPVREIAAAQDILRATGLLPGAIELISCPTCGRTKTDLAAAAERIAAAIAPIEKERIRNARQRDGSGGLGTKPPEPSLWHTAVPPEPSPWRALTVAVMGCAVNGPGEAAHADAGVAFGDGRAVLFRKGEQVGTVPADQATEALLEIVRELSM